MKTVVIGAGAVGLNCALTLADTGVDVTVIDARGAGGGASRRNAGWVVPSMSAPVPAPGVLTKTLKWALSSRSPVSFSPTLSPDRIRFLLGLLRNSTSVRHDAGLQSTLRLSAGTHELFDGLRDRGVDMEIHESGLIQLFTDEDNFRKHCADIRTLEGSRETTALSVEDLERTLPLAGSKVIGGIDFPDERFLRPDSFVDGLASAAVASGIRIETDEIDSLERSAGGTITAALGNLRWEADRIVLAAGAWTGQLTRRLGLGPVPVYAGKGYGFDIPRKDFGLDRALYLSEGKVAVTPFAESVRVAGTMTFGGIEESVARRRADGMLSSANRYLDWPQADPSTNTVSPWAGLRPMTPDGLPIIGEMRADPAVVLATGHAMLGITLAPVTEILTKGRPPSSVVPFTPSRFRL